MRSCLGDEAATDLDAIAVTWHLPEKENPNYPNEDHSRSLKQQVVVWLHFCLFKIGRAVFEWSEAMAALTWPMPLLGRESLPTSNLEWEFPQLVIPVQRLDQTSRMTLTVAPQTLIRHVILLDDRQWCHQWLVMYNTQAMVHAQTHM